MTLRPYQRDAVAACYAWLRNNQGNPVIEIPTGGGKTHVIRQIVSDAVDQWHGRVCILAHVKELLEQAAEKLDRPDAGIYSAGMNSRQVDKPITIAGIQSVYNRACEFEPFNLILVDEAHLVQPDGEGMYGRFLADAKVINPRVRLVGLSATPYRLSHGEICGPDHLFTAICYRAEVADLIRDGYLSPIRAKAGERTPDASKFRIRGGEFRAEDIEREVDTAALVSATCSEIQRYTRDRQSVLVFAVSVAHAMHLQAELPGAGIVTGDTPSDRRAETITRFRRRELKYLVNVNVLSVGFDAPNVDAIAMLRPTMSPGLYYQQIGRGLRTCEGKTDCIVLDFAGNVDRHGPIDRIEPPRPRGKRASGDSEADPTVRTCQHCREVFEIELEACPQCGKELGRDPRTITHDTTPAAAGPLVAGLEPPPEPETFRIESVKYSPHIKAGGSEFDLQTLRVDYLTTLGLKISEWVCVEHPGYAGDKARAWWAARSSDPFPESAAFAAWLGNRGSIAAAEEITTQQDGKFSRVVFAKLGPKPSPTFLTFDDYLNDAADWQQGDAIPADEIAF